MRNLWWRLVLPLAVLSVGALTLHAYWDWDGLLVNAATEVAGIVVTVAYVEWVLRRHEAQRWAGTQARVGQRIQVFVNATLSMMRSAFDISFDGVAMNLMGNFDIDNVQREVSRFSEQKLEPSLPLHISRLNPDGWQRLGRYLQVIWTRADEILDRYAWQLSPRQVELLLDIQNAAQAAPYLLQVFPEFAGVDPADLPSTRTPPALLQAHGYEVAAKEIRRMLECARELRDA
jgi:hypothetical protein